MLKSSGKWLGAALALFLLNGWINLSLMQGWKDGRDVLDQLRYRLDDAAFILLFGILALVFWAMFAVLPRERGYLYLGMISLLTSLQLFWDWDDKVLLFGPWPDVPHGSLLVKCSITFLFFSLAAYMLKTGSQPITRAFRWAGGMLWTAILAALLLSGGDSLFVGLNFLFLAHVFFNMALCIWQFITLLRLQGQLEELRFIGLGFLLFSIVLLPDPVKDLLELIEGRSLGYLPVFWEQCLEDTFAWALLSLLVVFGIVFFRRFVQTMKDNQAVSEELKLKNAALELEVETRQRLDQLFSVLLRTYRTADLEQGVLREGQRYFQRYAFAMVKYDEAANTVGFEGIDGPFSPGRNMEESLRAEGSRLASGEVLVTPGMVLGAAGRAGDSMLFLAVYFKDGGLLTIGERETFALRLMCKYVSLFYEYFQLIESRFKELEQRPAERAPWLSKLFMQIAEKERKRLASDLHDEVLQELLHIRRILDRTPAEPSLRQEQYEQLRIGLDNAEYMIRETCRELMPSFLQDRGILHAISGLVEKTRLRADFQLEFQALPIKVSLNDDQMTALYRVVQELINNAVKHSEAGRVTLEIEQLDQAVHIRYEDNGKGMDTGAILSSTSRLGIKGLQERIRMLGGQVSIDSEPGQGVAVRCSIPL
ncbi:sensor histidine kinase [Paenibacillus koleovorans]|uniref:sensor histidine kinase n=1 Tax=Paenibacillus koleovorans TaxID=121608 RepID=UPI000FD7CC78|nr:sensor histidine kinase [Paenibacillus koleovorans]